MTLRALAEQERTQARIARVVSTSAARLWRRMRGRTWEAAWREDVGPKMAAVITSGQGAAAASSEAYIAAALAELDMPFDIPTTLNLDAFTGVTGGGVDLASAGHGAVIAAAKAQYAPDLEAPAPEVGLAAGERFIEEFVATVMADAMRAAEAVAMAQRPWVTGYIRVIEPGACSRCAVLAGKFHLFNEGFPRHNNCRCDHVPAPEDPDKRRDLMTSESPERYFESLTEAEQNRIFTNAGAEAIRLGADIGQVVNARRGMTTSQGPKGRQTLTAVDVFGRKVYVTAEGTTRRGYAYKRLTTDRNADIRRPGERTFRTTAIRLMPETLLAIAGNDPAERIRLLRLHGFIT